MVKRSARLLVLMGLLLPGRAGATHVALETRAAGSSPSDDRPTAGTTGVALAGGWDATPALSFDGRLSYARSRAQPGTETTFGASGGNLFGLSAGLSWLPRPHLSTGAGLTFSPGTLQKAGTTVLLTDANGNETQAEALLQSRNGSFGAVLSGGWDSLDPDAETLPPVTWSVQLGVGATLLRSTQQLVAFQTQQGPRTAEEMKADCRAAQERIAAAQSARERRRIKAQLTAAEQRVAASCSRLEKLLSPQVDTLGQLPLTATGVVTLFDDTDLVLQGTLFVYAGDPLAAGFFSAAALGKQSAASFGSGMPIAPERWALRPEVAHRFWGSRIQASLAYERGSYLEDLGHADSLFLDARWKVTPHWRIQAGGSATRDVDQAGTTANAFSAVAKLRYTF